MNALSPGEAPGASPRGARLETPPQPTSEIIDHGFFGCNEVKFNSPRWAPAIGAAIAPGVGAACAAPPRVQLRRPG